MKPSEWQASSSPTLATRKPEELLREQWVWPYRNKHFVLWQRITQLHGTLRTLEQMDSFPFDYLLGPDGGEFWSLARHNFVVGLVVGLHAILSDCGGDTLTLRSFKAFVMKADWQDESMKAELQHSLRDCRFDAQALEIESQVSDLRHRRMAHWIEVQGTDATQQMQRLLDVQSLRLLFARAHKLFGVLSFGSAFVTLKGDLLPGTGRQASSSGVDRVLDAVIRDSELVHRPERDPFWKQLRAAMSQSEVETINLLRKRIGLPEV